MRKYLDKPRKHLNPIFQNPLGATTAGQLQMARDQVFHQLLILRFNHGLQIDRLPVASLLGEVQPLIEDVGHSSTHACGEIPSARSQDQYQAVRHVFAAVVADAFHHCGCSGIANCKALTGDSVEECFAAGCAVKYNIANQGILFRSEDKLSWWIHDDSAA